MRKRRYAPEPMDYVDFGDGVTGTIASLAGGGWARAWISTSHGQTVLLSPFDFRNARLVCRNWKRVTS